MNMLNFFLLSTRPPATLGTVRPAGKPSSAAAPTRPADRVHAPARQALSPTLAGLDADVIGLNEIENTPGVDPLGDSTGHRAGLNAILGAGTYDSIDTGAIGDRRHQGRRDLQAGACHPSRRLRDPRLADDPRFIDTKNRPALAQTFRQRDRARLHRRRQPPQVEGLGLHRRRRPRCR